jgi:Ig-like domain-containing protein
MMRSLLFVVFAVILAACGPLPAPIVRPTITPETPVSKSLKPRPSHTPRPTETPGLTETPTTPPSAPPEPTLSLPPTALLTLLSPTPTPTLRVLFVTATPAPPTPSALDCKLIWQSPPNGSTYYAEEKFSVGWNIKNVGTATWEPGSFQFTYLDGAKLAPRDDLIPLTRSVPPGQSIVLSVPMKAPITPRTYTTHWGIRQGDNFFCRLTLTIHVQ